MKRKKRNGVAPGCPLPIEANPLGCRRCRVPHEQKLQTCNWYRQMFDILGYSVPRRS
jgi:hypothetical protein